MDKSCKEQFKINEYLDKQQDLKKKGLAYIDAEFERHLQECSFCRREFEEYQQLFYSFSGIEELEPPEDFTRNLLAMLPESPRTTLPNWSLLISNLILTGAVAILFTLSYWLISYTNILTITYPIIKLVTNKLWSLVLYIIGSVGDIFSIIFGLVKALWAIVVAYPVPIITLTLLASLMFMVLVWLINSFQKENYA